MPTPSPVSVGRYPVVEAARVGDSVIGAVLIGSIARRESDRWSDIDLALGLAPGADAADVVVRWSALVHELGPGADHLDIEAGDALHRVCDSPCMPWWDPAFSDEERAAMRREMLADRPDLDLDNLLMGELAGPASCDRPDLPVWDYRSYVQRNPGVVLSDLTKIRFPVLFFEGRSAVTSVDEELNPFPSSYRGRAPEPVYVVDAEAIVRRYELEYEAGLQEWDHEARGVVRLQPLGAWRPIVQAWVETLQRTSAS